jgi:membrane-associated protein
VELLREFFQRLREVEGLLTWGGYPVLMAIIFSETGLLVGFFLPGDSLLVTAGVLVNRGLLNPLELSPTANLLLMNAAVITMAIVGDAVGFSFGSRVGPKIFTREQSFLFRRDRLLEAKEFYDGHGGKTIIIARFMPFARTFAPIVAGVGNMSYRRFALFNITGAALWVGSMTVLGYAIAERLDPKQIEHVVYLIIAISLTPIAIAALKRRLTKRGSGGGAAEV